MSDTAISRLKRQDIHEVAAVHRAAFPGFFLSDLGEPFLREFYRGFLTDGSVALVARSSAGAVVGAAVGHTDPPGFFRRLLIRRWYAFAIASLGFVIRHPKVIPRIVRALMYRGQTPEHFEGALLSSIFVVVEAQGLGVGQRLLAEWTRGVAQLGQHAAYLTTDAVENDGVNSFYAGAGWTLASMFETLGGRSMNCYTWADGKA